MISAEPHDERSGAHWCARFPGDATTRTLVQPFRRRVIAFITVLEAAGVHVHITATYRPPERAYLMTWAWRIAHGEVAPEDVPPMDGVHIRWAHPTMEASIAAAEAMVRGYAIRYPPVLRSRHTEGEALDMSIEGYLGRTVVDGRGRRVLLENVEDLYRVGASYGVIKLPSDPPHWSIDGR